MKVTITIKDTGKGKVFTIMEFDDPVGPETKQTPASILGFAAMKAIAEECAKNKGEIADVKTTI